MDTDAKKRDIEAMFAVGAQYGYSRSRRHPSIKPFIFGVKSRTEIIDLEKSYDCLLRAREFMAKLGAEAKQVMFVGNKPEARPTVTEAAARLGMPIAQDRWIGGTFTNFTEIKRRIARLEDLKDKREHNQLAGYTKKERLLIDREIAHLERFFGGMTMLKGLPAALFVVDPREEAIAVREANRLNVPVIALAGSDCDITGITYPVVANDATRGSIAFFVGDLVSHYETAFATRDITPPAPTENAAA